MGPGGGAKGSKVGFRNVDLENRFLLFLRRCRRKVRFKALGYEHGVGKATAKRYFDEMRKLFLEKLVPQFLYVRKPEDLRARMSEKVKKDFPDVLYLIDATTFDIQKPENFLMNRLSWSAYKGKNVFQVLCGRSSLSSVHLWPLIFFL